MRAQSRLIRLDVVGSKQVPRSSFATKVADGVSTHTLCASVSVISRENTYVSPERNTGSISFQTNGQSGSSIDRMVITRFGVAQNITSRFCRAVHGAKHRGKLGVGQQPAVRPMVHLRASSHTITARPPATTKAIPLTHTGMISPFTVTSQPKMNRNSCSAAMTEKRPIAMMVKGFFTRAAYVAAQRRASSRPLQPLVRHAIPALSAQEPIGVLSS
jgi:hypothetical protein